MPIQVTCPNGHVLSCPDDRAGRAGKCPKCGASFIVSDLIDPSHPTPEGLSPPPFPAELTGAAPVETFWFLCPNGHKLNGPVTLQGRPGQCPHCQARFIIPAADEPDEEPPPEDEGSFEMVDEPDAEAEPEEESPAGLELDFTGIESVDPALRSGGRPHIMAALFGELWRKRGPSGIVELHLRGGVALAPDWFAEEFSQGRVGMFASQEIDGTYALSIITWESVERVVLRGVDDLPGGLFE